MSELYFSLNEVDSSMVLRSPRGILDEEFNSRLVGIAGSGMSVLSGLSTIKGSRLFFLLVLSINFYI